MNLSFIYEDISCLKIGLHLPSYQAMYMYSNEHMFNRHVPHLLQMNKKKEMIYKAQEELERLQRQEEDRLMEKYLAERTKEQEKLQAAAEEEWEVSLKQLADQFDRETNKKSKKDKKVGVVLSWEHLCCYSEMTL